MNSISLDNHPCHPAATPLILSATLPHLPVPLLYMMLALTVSKITIFIKNKVIQMLVEYPLNCVCESEEALSVELENKAQPV